MMTLDEIRQVLDMIRDHEVAEFELEQEGVKLRVRKDGAPVAAAPAAPFAGPVVSASLPTVAAVAPVAVTPIVPEDDALEFAVVTSPMVGTFYRSPVPTAAPFVDIGQRVRKGQVLCIIEAMKLMNEIEAEYDGEVVKVYVENSQPVQYGERLFAIKTA
jgi:acetyl-CoA carboxylase biotin carboxyl carrier protein